MSQSPATPIYIHACSSHSALGRELADIAMQLSAPHNPNMRSSTSWLNDASHTVVGQISEPLPTVEQDFIHKNTRNNQLALSAISLIESDIQQAIKRYGAARIAVIVGTSTSGIFNGEQALSHQQQHGKMPDDYHYVQQELHNSGEFIADQLGITGPCYTISTACSSSGRVFLSAKRLLKSGLVDAVVVGGCDTLCKLTLNGFHALEATSEQLCNPFSNNRDGINIGEAAAFMLLSLEKPAQQPAVALMGVGDSSDAHHISAPHPEGIGAEQAMRKALADANLNAEQIGYINAHGTATKLNDDMEAKAIARVFGDSVPVSSTKPLTGHTLGAASAIEAAICWQILQQNLPIPAQINDGAVSPELNISLAQPGHALRQPYILSNSFAFGGNNISLIFGIPHDG